MLRLNKLKDCTKRENFKLLKAHYDKKKMELN